MADFLSPTLFMVGRTRLFHSWDCGTQFYAENLQSASLGTLSHKVPRRQGILIKQNHKAGEKGSSHIHVVGLPHPRKNSACMNASEYYILMDAPISPPDFSKRLLLFALNDPCVR